MNFIHSVVFIPEFIKEYNGCMDSADIKVVYYDIEVLQKDQKQ